LVALLSNLFTATVAGSTSPIDSTRSTGGSDYFNGTTTGSGVDIHNPTSNPSSVACFDFTSASGNIGDWTVGTWPTSFENLVNNTALPNLQRVSGGYLGRLCAAGRIKVYYSPTSAPGIWGEVYGTDTIVISAAADYSFGLVTSYLFAHETGHIYQNRNGIESLPGVITFSQAEIQDGGSLPSYSDHCGNGNLDKGGSEDFAESIGDWVQVNTYVCAFPEKDWNSFWTKYAGHKEYVEKVLTRP